MGELKWLVKDYNSNQNKIVDYNVLQHREQYIKKMKKISHSREEFSERMRNEMMYRFWSKAEYELIIKVTSDNHVLLLPWCGCADIDVATIDVTDDSMFTWLDFAKYHINKQVYKNQAKIDIYDQLRWRWEDFIDYLWNTRLRWERNR